MNISEYKSDITFQFLLFLIRKHIHRDSPEFIDPFDMKNIAAINFDRLFKLITVHKVELIVLPILKNMDLPKFDYNQLHLKSKQIVIKQIIMEKLLADIVQVLDKNNISNIVFKGVALNKKLYGNQNKRVYKDIDLLIKDADIDKTHNLLLDMGFKLARNSRYTPEFIERYPAVKYGIKDLTYIDTKSNTILELHWRISSVNALKVNLCNQKFFEIFTYKNKNYHILKNEYELAYLIQHGAGSAWHRLKWLVDVVDYIKLINIDKQLFLQIMTESKGFNKLSSDLSLILKETMMFEHNILSLDNKAPKNYLLKKYRQKYIIEKLYKSDLAVHGLTIKELFYRFVISSSKLQYLKTYAIGFYYKRKAIKRIKANNH